jgi:hypothetical protein
MLVDVYGGRSVAVVDGRVAAVGRRPELAERLARRRTGVRSPVVLRVPHKGSLGFGFSPLRLYGLS